MKLLFTFLALLLGPLLNAQDFNGQWKGSFNARGVEGRVEYVLEINVDGEEVTGYSYTYPVFGGKKYYDICEIKGSVNKKEKYIEISEVGKIKSNVPPPYRFDCFQTHKLSYSKTFDAEKLSGPWEPARLSISVCGYGTTVLERKKLKDIITAIKENKTETAKFDSPKKANEKKKPVAATKPTAAAKAKSTKPVVNKPKTTHPVAKENPTPAKEFSLKKDTSSITKKTVETKFEKIKTKPLPRFKTRTNKVLETIEVEEENVNVQLYDNGEIDGDTVTVTFNGEVVAYKKGLSAKPISINLKVKADADNELVMYAENLGSVPPNTALMVVWVDDKRYTVTISSDEKRNGSIIFRREN
ncbi:MAG: hypothetical protein HYX40_02265 [Sphingobacteriales bacterium]|nr:hypothetical protein [Sphingobacteriales bacterium]